VSFYPKAYCFIQIFSLTLLWYSFEDRVTVLLTKNEGVPFKFNCQNCLKTTQKQLQTKKLIAGENGRQYGRPFLVLKQQKMA
jgi:hypothetical protein